MSRFKILFLIFSIFAVDVFAAQQTGTSKAEKKRPAITNETQSVKELKTKVDSLRAELELGRKLEEEQKAKVDSLGVQVVKLNEKTETNTFTLGLMIFGTFLQLLGSTLLAGQLLSKKITEVRTLERTAGLLDLAVGDTNSEKTFGVVGVVGFLVMFSGYLLQYIGTVLNPVMGICLKVFLITLGVAFHLWLLSFFIRLSYEQSFGDKFKILWKSIFSIFCVPVIRVFIRREKVICDICLKTVVKKDAEVWWVDERTAPDSFVFSPHNFKIGHPLCLGADKEYDVAAYQTKVGRVVEIVKKSIEDFATEVPKLRAWFRDHDEYWAKQWNKKPAPSFYEHEFEKIIKHLRTLSLASKLSN